MSSITFQQNILFPPIMYHNQLRHDHVTPPVSYGTAQSLPYPYIQHVSFNRVTSFGNSGWTHDDDTCTNMFPAAHSGDGNTQTTNESDCAYVTMTPGNSSVTNKTEIKRNSCMKEDISGTNSGTSVDNSRHCNAAPTSPHRLTLPNIRSSDNFAKNVMSEESDLGYYSFCDMSDIKLDDMSPDVNVSQTNLSNIIDDVLDSLDEQMFALHGARQRSQSGNVADDSSCTQNTSTPFIPCSFQNVVFNFQNSTPEVTPLSWPREFGEHGHFCSTCNKRFGTKHELTAHLRFHKDGRPHKCPYCKKSFTQKSTLRTHIRTHTGEKPFSCQSCARAFSDYSTYRKHLRIHSGEKPYVCDVCKKSFTQSGNMIRHREIHFKKTTGTR